jgi:hypothetical protein
MRRRSGRKEDEVCQMAHRDYCSKRNCRSRVKCVALNSEASAIFARWVSPFIFP